MDIISSGEIFRDMAKECDLSLEDFSVLAEQDEKIDKELDRRMIRSAEPGKILEGRLTGHLMHDSEKDAYKVWLRAPLDVRVRRIAEREGVKQEDLPELEKRVKRREKSEEKRYRDYYDIDLFDTSFYDLVIASHDHRPEEIVERIKKGAVDEVREGED